MIAFKCGAKDVTAIDVCKDAVNVAKKNCIRNKCLPIEVRIADAYKYPTTKRYDFVAANIITQDLIGLGKKLGLPGFGAGALKTGFNGDPADTALDNAWDWQKRIFLWVAAWGGRYSMRPGWGLLILTAGYN